MTLDRFLEAQAVNYADALRELQAGRKSSHWMWYVFPQLRGLGRSERAQYFGIADLAEATAYRAHPLLGPRLEATGQAILAHPGLTAEEILGPGDAVKLSSSATLFERAGPDHDVFPALLDRFFEGVRCARTQALLDTQAEG